MERTKLRIVKKAPIAKPEQVRRVTFVDEIDNLQKERLELMDGKIHIISAPDRRSREIRNKLHNIFSNHLQSNDKF